MLSTQENERLTRVGPGTPMGNVFRRYWLPAALSAELPEPDGAPIRVRLLGEDLVAFRDTDGHVGLVSAFCPHRRAPMFFGRNEACGLRCVYHGWKFDRTGACVDMPSEPPDSLFKTKVQIESYPTWEGGGYVWAYLGPPALIPPPPDFELVRAPATHRFVSKMLEDCNYLQALEGGMDTTHTHFLHKQNRGDLAYLQNYAATVPKLDVYPTAYGYMYTGIRYVEDKQWVRGFHYIMPTVQMRGDVEGFVTWDDHVPKIDGHIWVPIDDEHTFVYNFMYSCDPAKPITLAGAIRFEIYAGRGPDDFLSGVPVEEEPRQRLPDRPRVAEARQLHRDRRRQHRGLCGAGRDGADRRPFEGTPRDDRPRRDRAAAPAARGGGRGRGGPRPARRRSGGLPRRPRARPLRAGRCRLA